LPARDLALLTEAALAAGEIARRHFGRNPDVREKSDGQGPVSEADLEVDRMLFRTLGAARPDYGWLSEETEDSDVRLGRDRVFIVDPIDGTRAFVAGNRTFAHSLAIAERGRVIAAVVHLPLRDLTYSAALGGGARLNGQPMKASRRSAVPQARVLAARPQLEPGLWPKGVPPVDLGMGYRGGRSDLPRGWCRHHRPHRTGPGLQQSDAEMPRGSGGQPGCPCRPAGASRAVTGLFMAGQVSYTRAKPKEAIVPAQKYRSVGNCRFRLAG
jgi:hypothetical protein